MGKNQKFNKEITQTYAEKICFLCESYVVGRISYRKKRLKRLL